MGQKFCALSVRKLKDGSYNDFREAWDGRNHGGEIPPFINQIMHLQKVDDPNTVISFGIAESTQEEVQSYFTAPERAEVEKKRQAAMAQWVEETLIDDIFLVADEIVPSNV